MPKRYALAGRVVTMDETLDVLDQGVVYVEDEVIADVRTPGVAPPAGFGNVAPIATNGTIYPGLIELHNHLSYNILPLFQVPKLYQHRGQWANTEQKRKFISGPMQLLAAQQHYVEAIVRYVECKCLVAGVTTSQGLTLSSAPGIEQQYRGVVRNVEISADPALPEAGHRIADIEDASAFLKALNRSGSCLFLHLSEGVTRPEVSEKSIARKQFLKLQLPDTHWAITNALAGIHATGLLPEDFATLAGGPGSIVWSPLSNLLLYGDTARVADAKANGIRIALGSDWSPTGSKNLLGELKVAHIYSKQHGGIFTDQELVAMATIEAARILKWDQRLGSLKAGKLADFVVIDSQDGGPYDPLLKASEAAVGLVVVNGTPRYGREALMSNLGIAGEPLELHGQQRLLNLADATTPPGLANLTLKAARDRLQAGLHALPKPPAPAPQPIGAGAVGARARRWRLVLDNDGREARAHRALAPVTTAEVIAAYWAASVPLTDLVKPMDLDELTVAEKPDAYFDRLQQQPSNLSNHTLQAIIDALPGLYNP